MSEILFADDDPAMRDMVASVFGSAGYRVRLAKDGDGALEELLRSEPDIAVLDYRMGIPDGLEVCRRIKSDPRLEHVPVLILTGESEIENRLAGFEAGADDYLAKPFDPRELLARVRAMLLLARRGLDRNPTSGLPGGEAVYREFERYRREGKPFCICYLDLDYFKPFSDRFGFAAADLVIRAVGNILAKVTRPGSFIGHVGGDDFVVFTDCDEARAQMLAAQVQLRAALREILPEGEGDMDHYRGVDREGIVRDFPLTRLTAALIKVDPATIVSLFDLSELVADTKRAAKRLHGDGIAETRYPAGESHAPRSAPTSMEI
jgi:PleD family two-component response regulator